MRRFSRTPLVPQAIVATMGVLCLVSAPYRLAAQNGPLVARAAGVNGPASVVTAAGSSFVLSTGFELNPGDRVDTRAGGRVTIDLSDGSMVIVEPQSVVLLKDFRQAGSLRELFEITLGNVRVRINHFAGRPNPYRMNSPTASIAVRGTEFSIQVAPGGDTQVTVYEGAVQVTSLSEPNLSILVEAGRGVLVRAGQDFRLQNIGVAPLGGRPDADADHHNARAGNGNDPPPLGTPANPQQHGDLEASTQRASAASTYDNYVASLSDLGQMPFLFRFNAFPEAHLDSLENPAYATQFTSAEGRLFLLPTMGGGPDLDDNTLGPNGARASEFSGTPQLSLFSPIGHSGFVAGGSVSYTGASNSSLNFTPDEDLLSAGQNLNLNNISGTSLSNYYTGSLVLARRFGSAGSFGIEMESLRGSGSLTATRTETDLTTPSLERVFSTSLIRQNRLTAGFSRDITPRARLGIFYRYGFISATDHDLSHTINSTPLGLNSTISSGHSSEFGIRLRGVLTPRLFYGFAGSWLNVTLGDSLVRTGVVNSHENDRAQRGALGFGIGYAMTRRAVLTLDVDAGTSRVAALRLEDATGNPLQNGTANGRFASTHLAIQFDLTRRLFLTGSYMHVWHDQDLSVNLFPDQSGATSLVQDSFFPVTPNAYQLASHFSDFGLGWRLSPNLFVQYLFTTDYDVTTPSHALMLRYTFKFRKD